MFKKDKPIIDAFLGEDVIDFVDSKDYLYRFRRIYASKDWSRFIIILSYLTEQDENRREGGFLYDFCEFRRSRVLPFYHVVINCFKDICDSTEFDISVLTIDNNTIYSFERRVG